MENIKVILDQKQSHFHRISPASPISEALCRMSGEHTSYLIVMDEEDQFLGLITEHDIACKTVLQNKALQSTAVKEVMNTHWPVADTQQSVEQCMQLMKRYHVTYLPVFEDLQFAGVVSAQDIIEEAAKKRTIIFDEQIRESSIEGPY